MSVEESCDFMTLMRRRDYDQIIHLLWENRELLLQRSNPYEYRHLAIAMLRSGRIKDAIEHYQTLIEVIDPRRRNDSDYCELGAAQWIAGEREEGINSWKTALKCNYGDGAKNMTPALLLYYGGVRCEDEELRSYAENQINIKLNTGWAKNWPAPLGRFLIEQADDSQVYAAIEKEHPRRQPSEHCRFLFYQGTKSIQEGKLESSTERFRQAVGIEEQTTISTEFVLAKNEVA